MMRSDPCFYHAVVVCMRMVIEDEREKLQKVGVIRCLVSISLVKLVCLRILLMELGSRNANIKSSNS